MLLLLPVAWLLDRGQWWAALSAPRDAAPARRDRPAAVYPLGVRACLPRSLAIGIVRLAAGRRRPRRRPGRDGIVVRRRCAWARIARTRWSSSGSSPRSCTGCIYTFDGLALPVDVRYYWAADPANLYPHPELAEHNGYNYSPAFEFVVGWGRAAAVRGVRRDLAGDPAGRARLPRWPVHDLRAVHCARRVRDQRRQHPDPARARDRPRLPVAGHVGVRAADEGHPGHRAPVVRGAAGVAEPRASRSGARPSSAAVALVFWPDQWPGYMRPRSRRRGAGRLAVLPLAVSAAAVRDRPRGLRGVARLALDGRPSPRRSRCPSSTTSAPRCSSGCCRSCARRSARSCGGADGGRSALRHRLKPRPTDMSGPQDSATDPPGTGGLARLHGARSAGGPRPPCALAAGPSPPSAERCCSSWR